MTNAAWAPLVLALLGATTLNAEASDGSNRPKRVMVISALSNPESYLGTSLRDAIEDWNRDSRDLRAEAVWNTLGAREQPIAELLEELRDDDDQPLYGLAVLTPLAYSKIAPLKSAVRIPELPGCHEADLGKLSSLFMGKLNESRGHAANRAAIVLAVGDAGDVFLLARHKISTVEELRNQRMAVFEDDPIATAAFRELRLVPWEAHITTIGIQADRDDMIGAYVMPAIVRDLKLDRAIDGHPIRRSWPIRYSINRSFFLIVANGHLATAIDPTTGDSDLRRRITALSAAIVRELEPKMLDESMRDALGFERRTFEEDAPKVREAIGAWETKWIRNCEQCWDPRWRTLIKEQCTGLKWPSR